MPYNVAVTRDMIEARIEALAGSAESDRADASDIVAAVYTTVEAVRRAPYPERPRVA